ncbi:MAG: chromosome segregation protein SMC [Acidobacteria bacterium RIFCSPLOWO2_12_FULL_59_11]|nr:MAG: chromosome segregation protein SMC [Acidobacteria bacterium RIFCSPLOWO2_12_FULL_59_11]
MITRLTLRNFKNVGEQVYHFTQFDLLVGRNNSGKSTVLQALAIWQFCVDEFHRSKRSGSKGIQVVLPNFTALPVPEFNLLWKDRTERAYPVDKKGNKKQEFILIEILVEWRRSTGETDSFGVEIRYHSSQTIYAIPNGGWERFRACDQRGDLPKIAYVPPFSGLEPTEKWLDISPIRQQVGKGQPGSVLRNLLLRVCPSPARDPDGRIKKGYTPPADWQELAGSIERWFSVKIHEPRYESAKDVYITVEYRQNSKDYDIIAGGSGFQQILTLLAFLYGYQLTTILFDEPDAHLHVNLQREILDYFKRKSFERDIQFLIATHAEEFVRGVDASQIVSLLHQVPKRIESTPVVLRAMADVSNEEITRLVASPYILYVEGESDERILRAWADQCGAQLAMDKVCFKSMGGGGKENMKARANEHFAALQQIIPGVSRLLLFDYDDSDTAFHPQPDNPSLAEWKRKNIENYLLVPDAWKRAALHQMECGEDDLFAQPVLRTVDEFFSGQNLTLPPGRSWRNLAANVFSVVDGKRILFENDDALFHQLRNGSPSVKLVREQVAMSMVVDEIHEDVHQFIGNLIALTALE